jgi:hypothetical protein
VRRAVLASLAGFAAASGCAAVPEVTFVEADAAAPPDVAQQDVAMTSSDAPADAPEAGAPAMEAAVSDAAAAGCPDATPSGATQCCGTSACKGTPPACNSECTNCSNNCPGQACCLDKHGNYTGCAPTPQACP